MKGTKGKPNLICTFIFATLTSQFIPKQNVLFDFNKNLMEKLEII